MSCAIYLHIALLLAVARQVILMYLGLHELVSSTMSVHCYSDKQLSIICYRLVTPNLILLTCKFIHIHTVILTKSPDSLCPGDTVVLTCVTDTGRLDWTFGKSSTQTFFRANQIGIPLKRSIFTVILYNITGDDNNTFWSSATVSHHVPLNFSETVSCSDGPGRNITERNISVGKS